MHRAGSRLGSSVECNFHILIITQNNQARKQKLSITKDGRAPNVHTRLLCA
jgi:hypothetical protein